MGGRRQQHNRRLRRLTAQLSSATGCTSAAGLEESDARLPQHDDFNDTRPGPLHGVKVLDMTTVIAGPMTTMFLADMGADVIKIEVGNGIGDSYKLAGTSIDAGGLRYGSSSAIANRGKRSISVNSKTPEGIEVIKHLATDADVFVQNMRPGVIGKLGVGPDDLMAINPDLIYCSISGFGQTGPWSKKMTVRANSRLYSRSMLAVPWR